VGSCEELIIINPRRLRKSENARSHETAGSGWDRLTIASVSTFPETSSCNRSKTGIVMKRSYSHTETHLVDRIGWLRAAVLGANDGIVSTASLIVGVAAASPNTNEVLLAGVAGLVAGAMSMAAGEYVSVSSQSDTELADLTRERAELVTQPESERQELADIYVKRGLDANLALQVADQLMAKDALGAHARDELGISEVTTARPVQAALTSAATFAVGAALPLAMVLISPADKLVYWVSAAALVFLALLGAVGAWVGGSNITRATLRVGFWGAFAMGLTAVIGHLVGKSL
jgi:vacuolar iron transporter family protein